MHVQRRQKIAITNASSNIRFDQILFKLKVKSHSASYNSFLQDLRMYNIQLSIEHPNNFHQ